MIPVHLKAAMARLRDLHYTNLLERYPAVRGDGDEIAAATSKWFADCRVAVEWFLDHNHEEDDEPATVEWLVNNGFERLDETQPDFIGLICESGELTLSTDDTVSPFSVAVANSQWPYDMHTRGQFRGLALQCGVVLQTPDSFAGCTTDGLPQTQ